MCERLLLGQSCRCQLVQPARQPVERTADMPGQCVLDFRNVGYLCPNNALRPRRVSPIIARMSSRWSNHYANKPFEWWPGGEKDGLGQHERVTEVKTYLVQLACPKCQKGELHYQEDAVFSPGAHTHVCDNYQCGWMVGVRSGQYPEERLVLVEKG